MRTSPSHLFFPFLQAVQARAPRFGMCDCICCCEDEPLCTVDMTCWLAPPVIRVSLRRFKDISAPSLGSDAEEEKDIRRLLSASAECLQASPLSARRNGLELEFPSNVSIAKCGDSPHDYVLVENLSYAKEPPNSPSARSRLVALRHKLRVRGASEASE
jgi:hypothetical protein